MKTERLTHSVPDCGVCERIAVTRAGENPHFVCELPSGYVVLGDHQYCKGYTLLLCRYHANELHELPARERMQFLSDMALTAQAVYEVFTPDKLNYELLGVGRALHMHWHIFPRRAGDTPKPGPIWQVPSSVRTAPETVLGENEREEMKARLYERIQALRAQRDEGVYG